MKKKPNQASVMATNSPLLPSSSLRKSPQPLIMHTLFGVALPAKARITRGLQKLYGIGPTRATAICRQLGINENTRCGERSRQHLPQLASAVLKMGYVLGTDRRRAEAEIINRYVSLNTVKSIRLRMGYPVRGQRTATNAKTAAKLNPGRIARVSSTGKRA